MKILNGLPLILSSIVVFVPIFAAEQWTVELGTGEEAAVLARQLADRFNITYRGPHSAFADVHVFEGDAPRRAKRAAAANWRLDVEKQMAALSRSGYAEHQKELKRVKRDLSGSGARNVRDFRVNDPQFPKSWYLNGDMNPSLDMNIKVAWEAGFTGQGVVVSILDDGIERAHADLRPNYDALASFDFNSRDSDPTPRYDSKNANQHGTRCAGQVAAAANNSICSVGVAYNARIGGIRMLDGKVTDHLESEALSLRPDHIDIFSASWGPPDDGETVDGPGHLARRALLRGILKGRDGKGSIFVWSSGNGGLFEDSCACDGYANSIFTLSISSATERGFKPWYLEECPSTIASTYSSGEPSFDRQIVTTDLRGGCTDNHTGTSASAPLAAGMVALALEANPKLTWRDVQHIVVETARPEPLLADGNFMVNGVGRRVSSRFGFGLMDAYAMVRLAENWKTVPEQRICTATVNDFMTHQIPPDEPLIIRENVDACLGTDDYVRYLEHVETRISLWYSVRGDLEIYLTSPSGTRSQLLPSRGYDDQEGEFRDWPFISVQFWGEKAAGNWSLEIVNIGADDNNGGLRRWSLIFHGTQYPPAITSATQRRSTNPEEGTTNFASPVTFWPLMTETTTTPQTTTMPRNCSRSCQLCDLSLCQRCDDGFYLLQQRNTTECVKTCPVGFCYVTDVDGGLRTCELCHDPELASYNRDETAVTMSNETNRTALGNGTDFVVETLTVLLSDLDTEPVTSVIQTTLVYWSAASCHACPNTLTTTLAIGLSYLLRTPKAPSLICSLLCSVL